MNAYDPKGLRFLIAALFIVLIGTGVVQGGLTALSSPDPAPQGAVQWALLYAIKLVTLGIGAVCLIIAKKLVDKYADRRPR